MTSQIIEKEAGLPFTVPIQVLKSNFPNDFYYKDQSKEIAEAVYLRALGFGHLVKISNS